MAVGSPYCVSRGCCTLGGSQNAGAGQNVAMSLPIVLQPEALVELDDVFNWYEQQRLGLGFQEYP